MNDFDYPTWAAQGRANKDKLPSDVAEALGPERDWADEVAEEWWRSPLNNRNALAAIIRSNCRPIGNDITDEGRDKIATIIGCAIYGETRERTYLHVTRPIADAILRATK